MLDNGSRDGSGAGRARAPGGGRDDRARRERRGKALNDSELLRARARALRAAAERGLRAAARRDARAVAGAAGAPATRRARARGCCAPTAARRRARGAFRRPLTALAGRAAPAPPATPCRAAASATREVDWCQSSALLVRREAAAQVDYLDPDFFVYSDEVDFARRLRDAGWRSLYVPRRAGDPPRAALRPAPSRERRIVELARNRDLYMRKHHSAGAARAVRWLTAWSYALRALAALVLPGHRHGATGGTSPRRSARGAARGCARRRRSTTARDQSAQARVRRARRALPATPRPRARRAGCRPRGTALRAPVRSCARGGRGGR